MTHESTRGRCRPLARNLGVQMVEDTDVLPVDTFADCPESMRRWSQLCPFHVWPRPEIPVPGRPDLASRSVEAVWQGLKLVDGGLDLSQLAGEPHKRPPDTERDAHYPYSASLFRYGGLRVGLITARYLIYLPAYLYALDRLVDDRLLAEIEEWLDAGGDVVFYDWDHNMDLEDPTSSFSHSALLARWFNAQLDPLFARAGALAADNGVVCPLPALTRYRAGRTVPNHR